MEMLLLKKYFKYVALVIVVLIIVIVTLVFGFNPWKMDDREIVETQYFVAQIFRKERYARILELTDEGKEQETLVVPETVESYPVKELCYNSKIKSKSSYLKSSKLKKIYLPRNCEIIALDAFRDCENLKEVVLLSTSFKNTDLTSLPWSRDSLKIIGISNDKVSVIVDKKIVGEANIIYHFNFSSASNEGYYWFDSLSSDNLYVLPTNPVRSGFIFTGWFMDNKCSIPWDGNLDLPIVGQINLYAGWIKV